jgi:CRP/FNR family transcriptional regulator, cyclic AMP receptor protein
MESSRFDLINANVRKTIHVTDEELQLFNSLLTYKKYEKKTLLLKEGEVCEFEGYILKGCVRSFFIDGNGFDVTLNFAIEDWWVGDVASFHDRSASRMYFETLEPTEMLLLSPTNKDLLLEKAPKFERMYRLMVQRSLAVLQHRLFATMAKSAQERYVEFLERYPQIPQRVAQHYIASYLGVSPEFLSKIRSRMHS